MTAHLPFLRTAIVTILLTTTTATDPIFTYVCDDDGVNADSINLTNVDVTHVKVLKEDGNYCDTPVKSLPNLRSCITTFKAGDKAGAKISAVTIVYEEEVNDRIVGGKNVAVYELECTERATKLIAKKTITVQNKEKPTTVRLPITAEPSLTLNNTGDIHIGDPLTLELTVNENYVVKPTKCTANSADDDTTAHALWHECTPEDPAIMPSKAWTRKTSESQKVLQTLMYAFRFIDSTTVYIKCETTVCPKLDGNECTMQDCPARKKRNSGKLLKSTPYSNSSKAVATVSFNVLPYKEQANSANGLSLGCYKYLLAAWICSMAIMRGL